MTLVENSSSGGGEVFVLTVCAPVQDKKTLDATFSTIVGECAFASSVIIGAICEVTTRLITSLCNRQFGNGDVFRRGLMTPVGIIPSTVCLSAPELTA